MKKGYIMLLIISFLIILLSTLNSIFNMLNIYTFILFLFVTIITILYVLGYEKNKHRYQKDIMLNVFIYSIVYIIITNILGIFIGFNKTGYSLRFTSILKNVTPVILIIILSEFIRYIITIKGSKYKTINILTLVIFVLFDLTLIIHRYKLHLLDELINFTIAVILPSISRNIMLIYLTHKVGYKPGILYRLIFELPLYFLPIFPDLGTYIGAILQIIFPAVILYTVHHDFEKIRNKKIIIRKSKFNHEMISLIGAGITMLIIVALSSGWLKYYLLTIGSESMRGSINKGDIIIVKKLNDKEVNALKEGDILVFYYSGKVIVHRIVRISEVQNNYYYYTKGDYNKTEDLYPVEKKDIIGTSTFKIPYLGYPTVWLNELISRGL